MRLIDNTVDTAFDTAAKVAVGVGKAAISLTGKIISDIQVRSKHKKASKASEQNRSVFISPYIDKKALLLNDDPDYDDVSIKDISGIDYLCCDDGCNENEKLIISGGSDSERARAFIQFISSSNAHNIPIVAIHNANRELEKVIYSVIKKCEVISSYPDPKNYYYHIFGGMNVDDIVHIIFASMKESEDSEPEEGTEPLIRSLVMLIIMKEGTVTVHNIAAFPLKQIENEADRLYKAKLIDNHEYDEIIRNYKAGSSARDSLRMFLSELKLEFEALFGKPSGRKSNIKSIINHAGAVVIDTGRGNYRRAVNLMLKHFTLMQLQGKEFNILIDNFPVYKFPVVMDFIRGRNYSAGHKDFINLLCGGDDDLFSELADGGTAILFRHKGDSSRKWSEYLGNYLKIKAKSSITQSGFIFNFQPSKSFEDEELEKPRISPATLSRLPAGIACISRDHEILITQI